MTESWMFGEGDGVGRENNCIQKEKNSAEIQGKRKKSKGWRRKETKRTKTDQDLAKEVKKKTVERDKGNKKLRREFRFQRRRQSDFFTGFGAPEDPFWVAF
eukprot:TRINITY_DN5705_c0_g1_i2.p1 TRINITY_DN5705_c0_g1~~TRINITY_DN5705_c0_g1_i2.p1  ORF type:complete len:101 (+),score=30.43 TRINITY_DN5705_c0_g1_i2:423-725(+)